MTTAVPCRAEGQTADPEPEGARCRSAEWSSSSSIGAEQGARVAGGGGPALCISATRPSCSSDEFLCGQLSFKSSLGTGTQTQHVRAPHTVRRAPCLCSLQSRRDVKAEAAARCCWRPLHSPTLSASERASELGGHGSRLAAALRKKSPKSVDPMIVLVLVHRYSGSLRMGCLI
jgi:hypothetical protein